MCVYLCLIQIEAELRESKKTATSDDVDEDFDDLGDFDDLDDLGIILDIVVIIMISSINPRV